MAEAGGFEAEIVISEDSRDVVQTCRCGNVLVEGSAKEVVLAGTCGTVMVRGNENDVDIAAVARIVVNGIDNEVAYAGSLTVEDKGSGNAILTRGAAAEGDGETDEGEEPMAVSDIVVAESSTEVARTCDDQRVRVDGSGNEVSLSGTCSRVSVNGSNNDVDVEAAGEIVLNGNENEVTYGGSPQIVDNGTGNTAVSLAGEVGDGSGDGNGEAPVEFVISQSSARVSGTCQGENVIIERAGNTVTLSGRCSTVTVNGQGNTIDIASVQAIVVRGAGNQITYGGSPEITDSGLGNQLMARWLDCGAAADGVGGSRGRSFNRVGSRGVGM